MSGLTIAATGGTSLLFGAGVGALGSSSGNFVKQVVDVGFGDSSSIDFAEVGVNGLIGGISGGVASKIPIKIPGISAGRNSFTAIAKSTNTKLANDTIRNVSAQTFGKAITGNFVSEFAGDLTSSALNLGYDQLFNNSPAYQGAPADFQPDFPSTSTSTPTYGVYCNPKCF